MDTKALKIFIDLATDLHFGKTSERNNMSASTLSRLIQRIEAEVGVALLERDNRHVALTSAGERYLAFARETLSSWQVLQEDIGLENSQPSGTVSLYCSVTASHSVLTRILDDLRQQQPQIEIKLHTGDQALSLARLKQGQEDFVIAAKPEQLQPQIAFKSLSVSDLVLIGPTRACAVRNQLDEMQLCGSFDWEALPWVIAERGITRSKLDHWFRQRGISPNIYAQVSGHEAIASMVALGCGVGLVPKLVLTSSPVFDSIQVLDSKVEKQSAIVASVNQTIDIGLCVLRRRISEPLINAVWLGVK